MEQKVKEMSVSEHPIESFGVCPPILCPAQRQGYR